MKIIDKTPLQDNKGNINIIARVQGTLKYGLNWFAEMEAQKVVIAQLDHALEKSFVLIRNFNLPGSKIIIPLILIGLGGTYVIYVTPAKGRFEAKGDQWNTIDNSGNSQPARINLLERVVKLTRAFQKFLEIYKIALPTPVEPILIAIDPGAHIEAMRPIVKVVKSDVIKVFISTLLQAAPVWRSEKLHALVDRIVEPRLREEEPKPESAALVEPPSSYSPSRFEDSGPAQPFDANDLGFAFEEEGHVAATRSGLPKSAAEQPQLAQPRPRPVSAPARRKILGMSSTQAIVLAGLIVMWCCVMVGLAYIYLNQ